MRHGSQQIAAHLFALCFKLKLSLFLDAGRHRACCDGDNERTQNRYRITGQREIERPVRIGENKVGKQHARDCGKGSVQKALGKPCNHERRQHINDLYSRHVIISRVKFPQNDARRCRQKQTEQRFQAVSCRYGKAPLEKSAYAVRHKSHLSLSHAQELQ